MRLEQHLSAKAPLPVETDASNTSRGTSYAPQYVQSLKDELQMVRGNAETLGKKLIAIKQEQQHLRQRGLNSQAHLDHMNELARLQKELLDSQENTAKVKNAWAKATRENLHSAKYQGSSILRATIDVTNRAIEHTNNVSRLRGAAQLEMLPIDHTQQPDVESSLEDIQEQHREISRRVDSILNILDDHLQSNRRHAQFEYHTKLVICACVKC